VKIFDGNFALFVSCIVNMITFAAGKKFCSENKIFFQFVKNFKGAAKSKDSIVTTAQRSNFFFLR
jgi:hypothetical protein